MSKSTARTAPSAQASPISSDELSILRKRLDIYAELTAVQHEQIALLNEKIHTLKGMLCPHRQPPCMRKGGAA